MTADWLVTLAPFAIAFAGAMASAAVSARFAAVSPLQALQAPGGSPNYRRLTASIP